MALFDDPIAPPATPWSWVPPEWDATHAPAPPVPAATGAEYLSRAPGDSPYQTPLSTDDEEKFQAWVKANKVPFDPSPNADYDMRGFWKAQQAGDERAKQAENKHFPDTWKTPYHKTFSNESIYADENAPAWDGDRLIAKDGTVIADETPGAAAPTPGVKLGFPHDPGPILAPLAAPAPVDLGEMPVDYAGPPLTPLAPGLGIPSGAIENALAPSGSAAAPVNPFDVDAISGGDVTPLAPGGGPAYPQAHGDELSIEERARQFAASTPEEQAKSLQSWQDAYARELRSRMDKVELDNQQRQVELHAKLRAAYDTAQKQVAQIDAESKVAANTKLDTSWSAGPAKRLAGIFAAVVGGLVQARVGGPNVGLQMIDDQIAQHIDAQKTEMANKRADLARRGASAQEQLQLASAQNELEDHERITAYTRAQNQVLTDMQQYDPRGKAALQLGQLYNDIGARRQQALEALQDKKFKDKVAALKADAEYAKTNAETDKLIAETAKLRGQLGAGGGAGKALAAGHENPMIAGLEPKDRARVVFSPDGKDFSLAVSAEAAKDHNDEIRNTNAAVSATDSVIADLLNEPGLADKLKAKIGLNPQQLAVVKTKMSLLKTQIAKAAAGLGKIPLAELHAVDAAIDDPSSFTSETLAQLEAARDETVDGLVKKFEPAYKHGDGTPFLTRDSFGHAPKLAEAPNAATVAAPLLSDPVKGERGYQPLDARNALGQLDQLYRNHVEIPAVQGPGTPGGAEQSQKDYQDQLDAIEKKARANVDKVNAEVARLSKVAKRTPLENEQLANAKKSRNVYELMLEEIPKYREKSVASAQQVVTKQQEREQLEKDLAERRAHPR